MVWRAGVGYNPKTMEDPTPAKKAQTQALAESILQVGATREVKAVPVAG